jgi:hypothetical protein
VNFLPDAAVHKPTDYEAGCGCEPKNRDQNSDSSDGDLVSLSPN